MIEYIVVRCCNEQCDMFQVMQQKKVPKWSCKICNQKQSVRKVYGTSYKASDLRALVMDYNMKKGMLKENLMGDHDDNNNDDNNNDDDERNRLEDFHDRKHEDTFSGGAKQSKWSLFLDDEEKHETDGEEDVTFVFENKKLKNVDKKSKKGKKTTTANNINNINNYDNDDDDDNNDKNVRKSEKAPSKNLVGKSKSFAKSKASYSEKRIVDEDDEDIDITLKKKPKSDSVGVYDKHNAFEPKQSYKTSSIDISKSKTLDHNALTSQKIKTNSTTTTKSSTEKPTASSGKWAQWLDDDEKESDKEETSESDR